jgi:uncharacterized membrane protein YebE (DUF533 family)
MAAHVEGKVLSYDPPEPIHRPWRRTPGPPWLQAELAKPLGSADVAHVATTPEIAAEMYVASLIAADDQNFMERAYLDELARRLKLDDGLKARLEQQVKDANDGT